ncbi:MAG: sigma-70 family RNA polymerase sigma factor [Planctomycetales bacterium]|nr:sigma-70 family RNA polymerase sigma factor [Planctomycetales bacterium]
MSDLCDEFRALCEAVRRPLLAFCRHAVWRADDAEDLLQSALLTAWRRFGEFRPGTNFRAWVFRIAALEARNVNRRSRGAPLPEEEPPGRAPDVVEMLEREWDYEALLADPETVVARLSGEVRVALGTLTPNERSVLLLRAIGDLAYREIGDALSMPLGSVMGFLSRARRKMRERLTEAARARGLVGESPRGSP